MKTRTLEGYAIMPDGSHRPTSERVVVGDEEGNVGLHEVGVIFLANVLVGHGKAPVSCSRLNIL